MTAPQIVTGVEGQNSEDILERRRSAKIGVAALGVIGSVGILLGAAYSSLQLSRIVMVTMRCISPESYAPITFWSLCLCVIALPAFSYLYWITRHAMWPFLRALLSTVMSLALMLLVAAAGGFMLLGALVADHRGLLTSTADWAHALIACAVPALPALVALLTVWTAPQLDSRARRHTRTKWLLPAVSLLPIGLCTLAMIALTSSSC